MWVTRWLTFSPYFDDGTLNRKTCLEFLADLLITYTDYIPLKTRSYVFFQQDGAPAYNALIFGQCL